MKLINLPNIITCCNLLCGCFAIYYGLTGADIAIPCLLIILGAVFDFFDGMTARALHISGPIGKELDSLADQVTFGVAPSVLCYIVLSHTDIGGTWVCLLAFLIAAFSALRLAKFNCDERQSLSFIGLPTPANAILWIGLVYVGQLFPQLHFSVYLALVAICCYLLISEIPMFSLKLKPGHNGFKENSARYIFLALVAVILLSCTILGTMYLAASAALIILLYILISIIDNSTKHKA